MSKNMKDAIKKMTLHGTYGISGSQNMSDPYVEMVFTKNEIDNTAEMVFTDYDDKSFMEGQVYKILLDVVSNEPYIYRGKLYIVSINNDTLTADPKNFVSREEYRFRQINKIIP
jgi:hypothetical protein